MVCSIFAWVVLVGAACSTAPPPVASAPSRTPVRSSGPAARPDPDDPENEIRRLEDQVARRPSDGEAWQALSVALRKVNRLQESARAGWQAVELLPGWETWTTLGNVFFKAGNMRATLAAYEKSAETAPDRDFVARNFLNVGYRAWTFADFAGAERAYRRAAAASDDNPTVHYDLANLYASIGRPDDARAEATRAIALIDALPIGKLPTQTARGELEVMRALLKDVLGGGPVALPPPSESGQVLPERFTAQPRQGQALSLKIDSMTMRMYPLDSNQMFALTVPSEWVETMKCQDGRTELRLVPSGATRALVLQVTAMALPAGYVTRAAAERAMDAVRSSGQSRVEPLQPLAIHDGEAYWFWATDLSAKENDDPGNLSVPRRARGAIRRRGDLRHDVVRRGLAEDSREILPLLAGSISTHRLRSSKPGVKPDARLR